jgi:hypothetical protein
MKPQARYEDGSRAPIAEAVAAVATHMVLTLQEAQPSVEQLGACLGRMIVTLVSIEAVPGCQADTPDRATQGRISAAITALRRDAANATVALQFHDRMTQNLMHLHDYLSEVRGLLEDMPVGRAEPAAGDEESRRAGAWQQLRTDLQRRLVPDVRAVPTPEPQLHGSDAQLQPGDSRRQRDPMNAIELF